MNDESNNMCERLDAFFDGALSADERDEFGAHLAECSACREAVDEQQWIDGLLQSDAAAAIEAAPAIALRRRPRRRLVLAAAAAVAALAAWPLFPLPRGDGRGEESAALANASGENGNSPTALRSVATGDRARLLPSLQGRGMLDPPVAAFASNGSAIAVPLPSPSAEVTIVKLYPTVPRAALRRSFPFTDQNDSPGG